jgi:hypothetical protein
MGPKGVFGMAPAPGNLWSSWSWTYLAPEIHGAVAGNSARVFY